MTPTARKPFRPSALAIAAMLVVGATPSQQALAANCTWNPPTGNWNVAGSWSCGVVPTGPAVDSATIGAGKTVTVNTAQSIFTLGNAGTINIDAAQLSLQAGGSTTNTGTLNVGGASTAALQMSHSINNAGGVINVGAGSVLNQFAGTLSGGRINTSGTGALVVGASSSNVLSGVTLGGRMDMASGFSLQRITNGLTLDNGTIDLGSQSVLSFEGTSTLAGTGSIVLGSGPNNRLYFDGDGTTTFAAGTTVRGHSGLIGGQINAAGTQTLVNHGTISADTAGGTITIFDSAVVNHGTLRAQNGGTLLLNSHLTGTATGQIVAGAGSTVVQSGVTLGGIVNVSGAGQFQAAGHGANFLDGVMLNGNLDMASGFSLQRVKAGGLVLNGSIAVGNQSVLSFEGNGGLSGNATIVLGSGPNNRVYFDGDGTTTFAAGTTVRGHSGNIGGQINIFGTQTLVNHGTISADTAGGTITIFDSAVVNHGTLSAQNGGTLLLSSNVTGGATGQIVAGAGSTVVQNGVTLSGILNVSGAGQFQAAGHGANFLDGVTLNGNLDMASGFSLQRVTAGGLVLNGRIDIGNQSVLTFEGNGGLSGNATVVLGSGPNNRLYFDGDGTTTFAAGTTVRGHSGNIGGQINIGGTQTLVNHGTISADTAGGTITIFDSAVVNHGTLSALNGGTLQLDSKLTGTANGQIVAGAGSTVLQNGVTLGGILNVSGDGRLRAAGHGANFLDGVTLNGNLDMASGFSLQRVTAGGLVLNGRIDIGNQSVLSFEGDGGLSGNGTLVLGSGPNNRVYLDGNGTTTFAAGTTVRGHSGLIGGQINIGGTQTLVNNGTIHADTAGGTIAFTDSALVNNGLVRASAGTVNVGVALSGTGTLQVDATGAMALANGAKTQGRLAMGATGAALGLGTGNLTITNDYTNVGAGTGNAFNRRAGVSGTGQIVAGGNAAQAITGASVSNGGTANATLTIGNVRVGATTFNYQVANTGATGPSLRGAIQTSVNGGNLTDARLSGSGVTASNYNTGAPGGNTGNLGVTFTAANAGALVPMAGQVLNLRSNFENIADQKLNIVLAGGAAAYNAAVGSATSPVQVVNQRVGGGATASVAVSNTAAAGAFSEDLHASIAGTTGGVSANGGITGRLAGANAGGGAIHVGVDTATSGAKTGTVTLNYQTAGTVNGVANGLGTAGAGSQAVTVNGNVYQAAAGALQGAALNFGTVQVGQSVSQALVVRNTAVGAAGFVEDLNASFGAASGAGAGLISGSGALNGIRAGNNSNAGNGAMTVSVNTAAAGLVSGAIAVNYVTAGAVNGVSNGLGTAAVGSQNFGVAGTIQALANVINQASPLVHNAVIDLGSVRVGAASPTANVSVSNQATAAPQAALNASIASNGAPVVAGGSFSGLVPGATSANALQVGLNTAVAGNFTGANAGSATLSLVSDASNVGNCGANCQLALASQTVSVSGKVYTQAVGQLGTAAVDFGVVRVGDTVAARNITVTNTAAATALNDTLRASLGGVGGPFTAGGAAAGIGAQQSGQIAVGLNTAAAGVFSQAGSVGFLSHNPDMADVAAGADGAVQVKAQVNNLANADFDLLAGLGLLTQNGTDYLLDLGNIAADQSDYALVLRLDNDVSGPADDLSGLFDLSQVDDFSLAGFGAVNGLAAGQVKGGLSVGFTASMLGFFEDVIEFDGLGTNASDRNGLAQHRRLIIRANVFDPNGGGTVPEPGSLALLLVAGVAALVARRQRRQRAH
ncbi:choice-of-anchor D domain-containing protein [Ideonella sp. A 288]|uniref:beta strand repeat-containing protein n=1 Tax=Ideonella sp. A 288 TaxID=1962181 RepID=UPI0011863F8A|nr:choice-of-anchor D domain-containing protein [Ideonella sp. A 288]